MAHIHIAFPDSYSLQMTIKGIVQLGGDKEDKSDVGEKLQALGSNVQNLQDFPFSFLPFHGKIQQQQQQQQQQTNPTVKKMQ